MSYDLSLQITINNINIRVILVTQLETRKFVRRRQENSYVDLRRHPARNFLSQDLRHYRRTSSTACVCLGGHCARWRQRVGQQRWYRNAK